MKARVKATGEILEVRPSEYKCDMQGETGTLWSPQELEFNDPDYWDKLLHQYAGMAMQGIMANTLFMPYDGKEIANISNDIATALVEKLKGE